MQQCRSMTIETIFENGCLLRFCFWRHRREPGEFSDPSSNPTAFYVTGTRSEQTWMEIKMARRFSGNPNLFRGDVFLQKFLSFC